MHDGFLHNKWGKAKEENSPLNAGILPLEHFHKCCSAVEAVFLAWGCVSARSQAAAGMLPRQNVAPRPKILAPHRHIISVNALGLPRPSKAGKGLNRPDISDEFIFSGEGGFATGQERGERVGFISLDLASSRLISVGLAYCGNVFLCARADMVSKLGACGARVWGAGEWMGRMQERGWKRNKTVAVYLFKPMLDLLRRFGTLAGFDLTERIYGTYS
jgi:hypothetical protein